MIPFDRAALSKAEIERIVLESKSTRISSPYFVLLFQRKKEGSPGLVELFM